jgi:pilus assembly protein CpaC
MASRLWLFAAAGVSLMLIAAAEPMPAAAIDARARNLQVAGADATSAFLPLGIGKSVVVDLQRDVKDVLVSNPAIANAVVRTARRAYLIGVAQGQTNIYFFDAEGRQIAGFDVAVTRDLNGVRAALRQSLPDADIRIEGVSDGVVLSGSVANAGEGQQAFDIAARLVGDSAKIANGLTIRGRDQVMLKVTVAEVQRTVLKQLGVDLAGSLGYGFAALNFNTDNPFTANQQGPLSKTAFTGQFKSVSATLQAMERAGVLRTLAEPNLTAISGESANFLAGGEFPVPGGFSCQPSTSSTIVVTAPICQTEVTFKKFGVSLAFTPVVMTAGRISLRVLSEVSEVTSDNALILQPLSNSGNLAVGTPAQIIPALKTRRAETTVELPSGGSIAMAGMIQQQTKQHINGIPGLMELPILGALFKSRDYINNNTELMILVTPYIVRAVAQKNLSLPDDGFADASDPATILLGRLTRIYGVAGAAGPSGRYHGNYGFILE